MAESYDHLKFWFQTDLYVHIRIALIYNTFLVTAHANRPNKQRALKPSIHLTAYDAHQRSAPNSVKQSSYV